MTHQCSGSGCGGCSKGCNGCGDTPVAERFFASLIIEGASALPVTGPTGHLAIQGLAAEIRKLLESPPLLEILAEKFGLDLKEVSELAQRILERADGIKSRSH